MYYKTSGERDVDRYCNEMEKMYEADLPRSPLFREARIDESPIAIVVITSPGSDHLKLIVSETEEPIHNLGEHLMQITTKSPVGSEIAKKLTNLKVGMILDSNHAEILEIIHPN